MQARAADVEAVRLALDEARIAGAAGDIPIGAVVLDAQGRVIARAHNARETEQDPTAHAEIRALRDAAAAIGDWRLTGCTIAVTLEPCPMCAGAIVLSRIDRLVFGAWNPEYGAAGSAWDIVRDRRLNHRVEVIGGVLEADCGSLVQTFLAEHREGER